MRKKLLLFALALSLCSCTHSPAKASTTIDPEEPKVVIVEDPEEPETPETPEEPHTPKVFIAEDVATYFNDKGEEEGIVAAYIESEDYWYLHYIGEESTDTSKDNLSLGISSFLKYIPLYRMYEGGYLFRYLSKYIEDPETYFIYVAVSSNWFAAVSIYSYIEDNHLITDVIIYDGRNGVKEEK